VRAVETMTASRMGSPFWFAGTRRAAGMAGFGSLMGYR
jgi:hypothetical protein